MREGGPDWEVPKWGLGNIESTEGLDNGILPFNSQRASQIPAPKFSEEKDSRKKGLQKSKRDVKVFINLPK